MIYRIFTVMIYRIRTQNLRPHIDSILPLYRGLHTDRVCILGYAQTCFRLDLHTTTPSGSSAHVVSAGTCWWSDTCNNHWPLKFICLVLLLLFFFFLNRIQFPRSTHTAKLYRPFESLRAKKLTTATTIFKQKLFFSSHYR